MNMIVPELPYTCRVSGYLTFDEPPGFYDVCEVCGWEDDALQLEGAASPAAALHRVPRGVGVALPCSPIVLNGESYHGFFRLRLA